MCLCSDYINMPPKNVLIEPKEEEHYWFNLILRYDFVPVCRALQCS